MASVRPCNLLFLMSDEPRDDRPPPARPPSARPAPASARDAGTGSGPRGRPGDDGERRRGKGSRKERQRGGPQRSGREDSTRKPAPTPVRAMAQGAAAEVPTAPEESVFEIDGQSWTARVLGRAGGAGPSRVSMLLLGFWSNRAEEEASAGPEPDLEALVYGEALEALSPSDLERAFGAGRPPKPRDEAARATEARGRGRRGGAGRRRRS